MKKRILSLLCVLALCLGLLPVTALAAGEDAPNTLWVGETQITGSGYWTTDANGKLSAGNENNYNVYYDGNGTLTLNNANIQGGNDSQNPQPKDYGIYAAPTGNQSVSLTINLIGSNTVGGHCAICVEAKTGDYATLVIQSNGNDPKGSLVASGSSWNGISVLATQGNVSLTINNASVEASSGAQYYHGVSLISYTASNPELSLTVNGGSLTAQGYYGIWYNLGSSTNPSTSLMVSDSALIKAIPNISASGASKPTPQAESSSGGIVFDGNSGTVYGSVTLQNDLTIDQDETLTIPEGATLDTNGNLTNNGTIVNKGTMNGDPTGGSGTVVSTPTITTESLLDGMVDQPYTATLEATGNNITWSLDSGTLPTGLTLNSDGTITGTPSAEGSSTFTVKAENSAGFTTKQYTLNIKPATVSVTGVKLDKTELPLVVGGNATLIATVEPDTATDKSVTWESSDPNVATVEDGTVTAVKAGEATITVKTVDGGFTDTCAVKVTQPVTGVTLDPTELSLYTGESKTLTAKVEPADATNQDVTWSSNNNAVATVENGTVKAVGEGEATITVTTAEGSYTATCAVKVTDPVYSMTTDLATLDFAAAYTGYDQPAAKTVTITNTGNQSLTLEQPASTNSFEVGNLSKTELAPNEKATFTVQPKADLAVGSYEETINISGSNGNNQVSTSVDATFAVVDINDTSVDNKLTITSGISVGISDTAFTTPEAVKAELTRVLVQDAAYTAGNTAFYDVKLQYSLDGGNTWFEAAEATFPTEGITVTLPYPSGTGKDTHNFRVVHMFTVTSPRLGTTAGNTETPAVTKTDSGLQVTLKGLSPVVIGWDKIETPSSGASTTPAATATPAPSDNITYYTCPSCGYHNWTATDAGYRCDNCGYLESIKQLSGYGNVKGTYTPGSGATSTAASTVPQTGDESNPVLWTVLLLVSGLALGGLAIAKRKKQQ